MRVTTASTILVVIALGVGVATVTYFSQRHVNRFRVTVEVDTPEGPKSGSSVIETEVYLSSAKNLKTFAKGAAIVIDLGAKGKLVGVLGFGPVGADEQKIFGLTRAALAGGERVNWQDESKLKGRGELSGEYIPALVFFSDPRDPKTAKLVTPVDLDTLIGPGYRFKRAFLETTNASISSDIASKLPWWSLPGRPAEVAWRSWLGSATINYSIEPERLFLKE